MLRTRVCALALLAGTAAAGCGGATGGGTAPKPSASATGSNDFTSSDFRTVVPTGWSDATQNQSAVASVSVNGTVLMLVIAPPTSSNVMNEHIDVSAIGSPVPDDQLSGYLQSVQQKGATDLSQPQTFSVDGTSGLFITYDYTPPGGVPHRIEDMVVNRNGTSYEIVFNTASADFTAQLPALQQVLSSWHWTD